jgi:hypothetical protein
MSSRDNLEELELVCNVTAPEGSSIGLLWCFTYLRRIGCRVSAILELKSTLKEWEFGCHVPDLVTKLLGGTVSKVRISKANELWRTVQGESWKKPD